MDQGPIDPDTELPFLLWFSIKELEDICMIKSILRKHKYHQILKGVLHYRSGKAYVEDDLQTLF